MQKFHITKWSVIFLESWSYLIEIFQIVNWQNKEILPTLIFDYLAYFKIVYLEKLSLHTVNDKSGRSLRQ